MTTNIPSDFRQWCDTRWHTISALYRRDLSVIVNTCREYAEGNIWEERHTETAVKLLERVAIEHLGMFDGEVPPEDRQWFMGCLKPDYDTMLQEAIEKLPSITALASNASI